MFKAPIHKHDEGHILLRHSSRVNRLAAVSIAHGHKMELVPCVDVRVGNNNSNYTHFNWNKFLRDAYLALNRLPDDDVEAHHIKGMLTKAVEMFNGTTPFEGMEYSVTMKIVSKLEDWEVDVISGKKDADRPPREGKAISPENFSLVIPVPPKGTGGVVAALIETWGVTARQKLIEGGFENVSTRIVPWSFFVRSQPHEQALLAHVNPYLVTLRAICDPGVSLPEQYKHFAMVRVYHDMFTHNLPVDTTVTFTPTLTMIAILTADQNTH